MTPSKLDEEAMSLIGMAQRMQSEMGRAAAIDELAKHVRRLVEENERMRKGLEQIRATAADTHTDDYGDDQLTEAQIEHICDLVNESLTHAPAVETKANCETCYDTKIVMDDSGGRTRDVEVPCPDCATPSGGAT